MGGGLEGIAIRRRLLNLADVVFVLLIPPLLPRAALYHAPCSSLASTQRGRDSEAKTTTSPDEDSQTSTTCTSSSFPYPPHSTFAPFGSEFVSCSCTTSASSERDRFSPRVLILSLLLSRQPLHDVQASHVTRSIQPAQYIIRASLFAILSANEICFPTKTTQTRKRATRHTPPRFDTSVQISPYPCSLSSAPGAPDEPTNFEQKSNDLVSPANPRLDTTRSPMTNPESQTDRGCDLNDKRTPRTHRRFTWSASGRSEMSMYVLDAEQMRDAGERAQTSG